MERATRELRVVVTAYGIQMSQQDDVDEIEHAVTITADQVDLLVQWLKEAQAEIEQGREYERALTNGEGHRN